MKTRFTTIDFAEDGTVEAMNRDEFNIGFLGKQSIQRASEIKFNEATQSWNICLPDDDDRCWVAIPEATGFASYNVARDVEVFWLETARRVGVNPTSMEGIRILQAAKDLSRVLA
jgi:hypothetical protein